MFLRVLAVMAVLFLASCGSARLPLPEIAPYRMEIQQGNFISQEMVSQLKPGMSKDQVRFILGTPLITDSFHADRWDYLFRRQKVNSSELEHRKLTVFFAEGKLTRVESDVTPGPQADPAAIRLPEPPPAAAPAAAPDSKASPPVATVPPPPAQEAKPPASAVSEPPKPAQTVPPSQPAAAPAAGGSEAPKERSWWERLKDKVKF
jgi:outer membrane protein assembly factor BamE